MKKLQPMLLTAVLVCFLACPFLANAARPIDINMQTVMVGAHPMNTVVMKKWAEELDKASNGSLKMHVFSDASLVKSSDMPTAITTGTLDIGLISAASMPDIMPLTALLAVPFISKDTPSQTKFFAEVIKADPDVAKEQSKIGKPLALWAVGGNAFFSTVGPIRSPADLKGKRILNVGGPAIDYIKAWGAIPVQGIASELYMSLQRGVGDIALIPMPIANASKIYEIAKDVTFVEVYMAANGIWISNQLWNDLSAEQKKVVEETTKNFHIEIPKVLNSIVENGKKTFEQNGCKVVELTPQEVNAFAAVTQPVHLELMDNYFKRYKIKKNASQWHDMLVKTANSIN